MEPDRIATRLPDRHRALFLSDLHLGTLGSRPDLVLGFLRKNTADTIFLVGDIFDVWDPLLVRWGATERQIVELLRQRAAEGSRLVYLHGNHDAAYLTDRCRSLLRAEITLPVEPLPHTVHVMEDGRRLLVLHGDICDARPLRFHLLTRLGSRIDSLLLLADVALRKVRIAFGPHRCGPWKTALSGLNSLLYRNRGHERRLVQLASDQGLDGVICGHFHIAALHDDHGPLYVNCGDWSDSFTAIVETRDGRLQLVGIEGVQTGLVHGASPVHGGV